MTTLTRGSMIAFMALAIGAAAAAPSLSVRPAANPPIPIARITAGPAGNLACLDWKTLTVKVVSAKGTDLKMDLALPADVHVTDIGGGDGQMVVTTARHGTFVLSADGSVRARLAMSRFTPYIAATVEGDTAFGMGSAGDENGRMRDDWLITRVDLRTPAAGPREIVSDEAFADPFARTIFPLGYLLLSADGSTLYAVWEGSPVLEIIPTTGGSPRAVTFATGNDAPPRATRALGESLMTNRNAFYGLRSKFRWPQGLLRGPDDTVAILFREPASRGNAFTIDLYSRDGKKIGSTLSVGIEPRSATAQARTVVATDGRQYVLVNEPNSDYSGVSHQALYAIDLRK
jgi:hypothetical protein